MYAQTQQDLFVNEHKFVIDSNFKVELDVTFWFWIWSIHIMVLYFDSLAAKQPRWSVLQVYQ